MAFIYLFIIKSVVVSAIFTAWYCMALRNKKFHTYNRFFLLVALYASIQAPLLHFQWWPIHKEHPILLSSASYVLRAIGENEPGEMTTNHDAANFNINPGAIILVVAAIVSLFLLITLVSRILWVLKAYRKYPHSFTDGAHLIYTHLESAPFSFLNLLFWKKGIAIESENGQLIFKHEITHIRQGHTYDKLACQLLTCLFWMNPFYWFIQKELSMIHEFIADECAIDENDTFSFAKMLLQVHGGAQFLSPEHQFFSSPIKRRLTMLQTSVKVSHTWLRRMMVLPLIAGTVLIFSFTERKDPGKAIVKAENKIVLVLDAGHGGADAGAIYGNLVEKDLNLRIVKRIRELSSEYNVVAHLTRSADKKMELDERVAFSNKLQPDAFISIHINDLPGNDTGKGTYEIAINYKNSLAEKSEQLASTIYQYLALPADNQGKPTIREKSLYVLKNNTARACLIEMGDIKNKHQMERITNNAQLDELCRSVLRGIVATEKQ